MSGSMYVFNGGDDLEPIKEEPFEKEVVLQNLVTHHSELLAGEQMSLGEPRRWLLIGPEMGIPGEDNSGDRWSLDHLFVDQDAIPSFVEVKRSSDTRIRREVVGQMLDYAANAIVYWPIEKIKDKFYNSCEMSGDDPDEVLIAFLNLNDDAEEQDPDQFWDQVETNIKAGKIRLIFLADKIPPELLKITEFLNERFKRIDVLAVEVKQFIGANGSKTLSSQLLGQTLHEKQKKASNSKRESKQWDEHSFLADLQEKCDKATANTIKNIYEWSKSHSQEIRWGQGIHNGSFKPSFKHNDTVYKFFCVYSSGKIEITFGDLKSTPFCDDENNPIEFRKCFNSISGVDIPDFYSTPYPKLDASALNNDEGLKAFYITIEWALDKIKNPQPVG